MQYLLMICGVESDPAFGPEEVDEAVMTQTRDWVKEMADRGVRKFGSRLRPASAATMVRVRDNETLVSDGPFAETKEHILGFDLIECDDLDAAIAVAAKHPAATFGSVEVRPLWPERAAEEWLTT
jgi:hypothetical protein